MKTQKLIFLVISIMAKNPRWVTGHKKLGGYKNIGLRPC